MKIGSFFSIFAIVLCFAFVFNAMAPSVQMQATSNDAPSLSTKHDDSSRGFNIFADLLFWIAKEAGPDNWAEEIVTSDTSSNDLQQVHFGFDPGFRIGVGYKMHHDQWDTQVYYTWFHTVGKDRISSEPGRVHSTFLGNFYVDNPFGIGLSGPSYQKASIDWTIRFNMFDWELGHSFWISKSLTLRPFVGIKGGWIDQSIHSKWQNPDLPAIVFFNIGTENLKNNFWGLGPGAGMNTRWNMLRGPNQFYLFGDFSGAILWGHWSFADRFENDLPQQVSVDLQDIRSGSSTVRIFMGFGWEVPFNQNRHRFSTKLGYESQFWLNQLQFYSFTGGRLVNALTLQGGTFELCLDF